MTTTTVARTSRAASGGRLRSGLSDALTMTWRNLLGYVRIPQAMFFSSVQPIMFVLMFRYVFGGAIRVPGLDYVNFLMPGIFVQTVSFGAIGTAIGLADDMQKGLVERFRSLPMARSAVLAGRTTADLCRNLFVIALITGVGYAVGFRVQTGVLPFLGAVGVMLAFGYAMAWGFAAIGLSAANGETAQLMAFPIIFPLSFASSAFVPTQTMPGWLQAFAQHQPLTATVNAARALMLGGAVTNKALASLAWSAGLLAVLAPIAVHRYRRAL